MGARSVPVGPIGSCSFTLVVQSLNHVQLFAGPWTTLCHTSLSFTVSQRLLRFMSVESVMLSIHLTLCCRLFLLPLIFPSIMVFSSESALHTRWPKDWSLSWRFSISPSNEHSGLISFRFWLAWSSCCPRALKSLLQQHNWEASVLQHSAFFMVQLLLSYVTTGKTTALTIRIFVGKVIATF